MGGKNRSFEVENILKEDTTEKRVDSCYFKGVLKAKAAVKIQTPTSGHQTLCA